MKKLILTSILIVLAAAGATITGQDRNESYLGLPGDNLNLFAVMKLFQESQTLEEFERNLNDQNSRINNLDLNGDNLVDYIRVIDNTENNVHYIVLQVAVNAWENQDVAVFTVQRFGNGAVQLQLVGDEDLYGRNYIVEPYYDTSGGTPNPGYAGNNRYVIAQPATIVTTTCYEISAWPIIRFIYLPGYVFWRSSWYWGFYPEYWHPWRPYYWHHYYGYHYNWHNYYYGHYRIWHTHRFDHWNDHYYASRRVYSPAVRERIHAGSYSVAYSRPETRRDGEEQYMRESRGKASHRTADNRGTVQERRAEPVKKQTGPGNYGTPTRRTASRDESGYKNNHSNTNIEKAGRRKTENIMVNKSGGYASTQGRENVSGRSESKVSGTAFEKMPQERRTSAAQPQSQSKGRSTVNHSSSAGRSQKPDGSSEKGKSTDKTGRR